jgi:hypothetical protein
MVVAAWDFLEIMQDVIGEERFQTLRAFLINIRRKYRRGEVGRRFATVFGHKAVHGSDVKPTHAVVGRAEITLEFARASLTFVGILLSGAAVAQDISRLRTL